MLRRRLLSLAGVLAGAVVALAVPRAAHADTEAGPFGLGLIIGSPTGIALKYYLSADGTAIDGAVGGALAGQDGISVHADFLFKPIVLTREEAFDLGFYFGAGVRILDHNRGRDDDDLHVGLRAPAGILFDFNNVPLDVFLEAALILDFRSGAGDNDHSGIGLDLNAGIGVRYYF